MMFDAIGKLFTAFALVCVFGLALGGIEPVADAIGSALGMSQIAPYTIYRVAAD